MVYDELEFATDDHLLIPGDPKASFRYQLKKMFRSEEAKERLRTKYGRRLEDLGTHSLRKGSTSDVHGGGPSALSVRLRSEHPVGSAEGKYWRYEHAGDQHVGRTVAGLPPDRPEFAALPPHFVCGNDEEEALVEKAVQLSFVNHASIPVRTRPALRVLLATVLYHKDYLLGILPAEHKIRATPLFNGSLGRQVPLSELTMLIRHGLQPSPVMTPTGIPPTVQLATQFRGLSSAVQAQVSLLQRSFNGFESTLHRSLLHTLSEAGIGGETVSEPRLRVLLTSFRADLSQQIRELTSCVQTFGSTASAPAAAVPSAASTTSSAAPAFGQVHLHAWSNGRARNVPEDWRLPACSLKCGWLLWFQGQPASRIPPFRHLQPRDFSDKNQRKYFSDWSAIMDALSRFAMQQEPARWQGMLADPTTETLSTVFDAVAPHLERQADISLNPSDTGRRNKRRVTTLNVLTAVKHWRTRERRKRARTPQ
jgi:hypothetical protein